MNFTHEELVEYRQALRDRICSICKKFGYDDMCGVGAEGQCPFDVHLTRILDAVLSTPRSNNVADYLPAIRENVCAWCPNQNEWGGCKSRDHAYCGLDSFIVLVVQAIEDTYDRLHQATHTAVK